MFSKAPAFRVPSSPCALFSHCCFPGIPCVSLLVRPYSWSWESVGTVSSVSDLPASFPHCTGDGLCLGSNLLRLQNATDSGASVTEINFHSSGGLKSKTKILSGLVPGELLVLGMQRATFLLVLTQPSLWVCLFLLQGQNSY